jgi:hypothetical protein
MPSRLLNGEVWADHGGVVAGRTHTVNYRFVLPLPPGAYVVHAKPDDASYPSCTPVSVQVPPGRYADVGIECQSR